MKRDVSLSELSDDSVISTLGEEFAAADESRVRSAARHVVASQVAFLSIVYLHALWQGELSLEESHISGAMDDDERALLCGLVSIYSMWALLSLELRRACGQRRLRLVLAALCCAGITGICVFRESYGSFYHHGAACVAFGAGTGLVLTLTACYSCCRAAAPLAAAFVCTTTALALRKASVIAFSQAWLALGEISMIVAFGVCVASMGHEGLWS